MSWLTGITGDTGNDVEAVRLFWPTVDEVDPDELAALLVSARVQCEAFAPSLSTTDPITGVVTVADVPVNYRHAQAVQARALYRSGQVGSGDQMGGDGMTVTVFPMDWTVKALLRPRRGAPVIA